MRRMDGRAAVTGVQRLLAVLALVAGVLAMHSLTVGHEGPPVGASAMSTSTTAAMFAPMTHQEPAPIPPRHAGDPADDRCSTGCDGGMGQVGWMCLAVIAGAAAVALLVALSRRGTGSLAARLTGWLAATPTRLAERPPRPPSLVLLCIART